MYADTRSRVARDVRFEYRVSCLAVVQPVFHSALRSGLLVSLAHGAPNFQRKNTCCTPGRCIQHSSTLYLLFASSATRITSKSEPHSQSCDVSRRYAAHQHITVPFLFLVLWPNLVVEFFIKYGVEFIHNIMLPGFRFVYLTHNLKLKRSAVFPGELKG